eukprot:3687038-Rhodomonas_salina.1
MATRLAGKWKKWALSMRTLLDHKDGSLLDAVLLWKKNVDQVRAPLVFPMLRLCLRVALAGLRGSGRVPHLLHGTRRLTHIKAMS